MKPTLKQMYEYKAKQEVKRNRITFFKIIARYKAVKSLVKEVIGLIEYIRDQFNDGALANRVHKIDLLIDEIKGK